MGCASPPNLEDAQSQTIIKIWIFIGVQQTKAKVDLLDLMQRRGADVHIVRMASAGRNSLDKPSWMIEYLMRRGKQRPASTKTLIGSAAALFQPRLEQAEVVALLEKLRITGVFEVIDNKVIYGLPD